MRKIEQEMKQYIRALASGAKSKGWTKGNMIVANAGDRAHVYLHGNHIGEVMYKQPETVNVNINTLRRWPSMTTRSRLRALGADLVSIKGTLHLNGRSIWEGA